MIRVFTDRNVLIVKFIQIKYIKQPSFKPDFSLKHTFTNQYIAINRFSEKKKKGHVIYFLSKLHKKLSVSFPFLLVTFSLFS